MRLSELTPRWLNPNVFAFLCPCCRHMMLTCKNIVMGHQAQFDLFEEVFGPDWNMNVVPMRDEFSWTFSGIDFDTLTVSPSIDASNCGHWHGNITNGVIQ